GADPERHLSPDRRAGDLPRAGAVSPLAAWRATDRSRPILRPTHRRTTGCGGTRHPLGDGPAGRDEPGTGRGAHFRHAVAGASVEAFPGAASADHPQPDQPHTAISLRRYRFRCRYLLRRWGMVGHRGALPDARGPAAGLQPRTVARWRAAGCGGAGANAAAAADHPALCLAP